MSIIVPYSCCHYAVCGKMIPTGKSQPSTAMSMVVTQRNPDDPLFYADFTVTGMIVGSDITILQAGTETILQNTEDITGTSSVYTYSSVLAVDVTVYKPGYIPAYIKNYTLTSAGASLPIVQVVDTSYLE